MRQGQNFPRIDSLDSFFQEWFRVLILMVGVPNLLAIIHFKDRDPTRSRLLSVSLKQDGNMTETESAHELIHFYKGGDC